MFDSRSLYIRYLRSRCKYWKSPETIFRSVEYLDYGSHTMSGISFPTHSVVFFLFCVWPSDVIFHFCFIWNFCWQQYSCHVSPWNVGIVCFLCLVGVVLNFLGHFEISHIFRCFFLPSIISWDDLKGKTFVKNFCKNFYFQLIEVHFIHFENRMEKYFRRRLVLVL